jgi:hypothetical protein
MVMMGEKLFPEYQNIIYNNMIPEFIKARQLYFLASIPPPPHLLAPLSIHTG